jgi:hypothetical protein
LTKALWIATLGMKSEAAVPHYSAAEPER